VSVVVVLVDREVYGLSTGGYPAAEGYRTVVSYPVTVSYPLTKR